VLSGLEGLLETVGLETTAKSIGDGIHFEELDRERSRLLGSAMLKLWAPYEV